MQFDINKFLQWLRTKRGKKISFAELENWQSPKTNVAKNKKKKKPKKKKPLANSQLHSVLHDFEQMGLITSQNNFVKIKKQLTVTGNLSVARSGVAFLEMGNKQDLFVGQSNRNQAGHRDLVKAEIIGKSYSRYEARVVEILKSFHSKVLAQVIEKKTDGYLLKLLDLPDNPFAFIEENSRLPQLEKEDIIIVEKTEKIAHVKIPHSLEKNIKNLRGKMYSLAVYSFLEYSSSIFQNFQRVLHKYNLDKDYPSNVIPTRAQLKVLQSQALKDKSRRNLTSLFACTIDGEDSKDFDDAVSVEAFQDYFVLYVHIADVSYYVENNSNLDLEARRRSTSYYLEDYVLPMLPPILSEEFCSLKPKSKRPAFTCQMKISAAGEILAFEFYKSIVYLNKRYTYNSAQKEIDKKRSVLHPFWQLAKILIERRNANGKINLEIPEPKLIFNKKGKLVDIGSHERLDSHKLIEEFMLSANICASRFTRQNRIPSLYRVHEDIPPDNIERINDFLKLYGHRGQLKTTSQKEINKLLQQNKNHPQQFLFHFALLRSFSQAYYYTEPLGHWGLAFDDYAHFTSPIRRYPDLVVHRQIAAFLTHEDYHHSPKQLGEVAKYCSQTERLAMDAERDMFKLLSIEFMQQFEEQVFEAWLSGFSNNGLYILLHKFPIEGIVPLASFSKNFEIQSLDDYRVFIPKFQKNIHLGNILTVRLVKANYINMRNEFEIVSI